LGCDLIQSRKTRDSGIQTREQGRRDHVAGLARQLRGRREAFALSPIHAHHIDLRIVEPVLRYAGTLVELPLDGFVALARARCSVLKARFVPSRWRRFAPERAAARRLQQRLD
jgi:hypothetical protein